MNIDDLFTGERVKDKRSIMNAIYDNKLSKEEFEKVLEKLKSTNYYEERKLEFESDKSKWTADYLSDLDFKSTAYFSEEFLRHFYTVAQYVRVQKIQRESSQKLKTITIVVLIAFAVLFVAIKCGQNKSNVQKAKTNIEAGA